MVKNDAKAYAASLAGVVEGTSPVATWQSFRKLAGAFGRIPDLRQILIAASTLPGGQRTKVIDDVLREWSLPVRRLVDMMAEDRQVESLPEVLDAYTRLLQAKGYPHVVIESADPLPRSGYLRIVNALPGDRMRYLVETRSDRSLIGGVRVRMDDREYDLSIGGAVERIAEELVTS